MKVGSKPLKGILLSVKMGFFYAPNFQSQALSSIYRFVTLTI